MYELENFNIEKVFKNTLKINKKIVENYFENCSGYNRDFHDIALTYSYFFTKLFAEPAEMIKVRSYYLDFLQKQQAIWKDIFIDCREKEEGGYVPLILPEKGDNRFKAPQWNQQPYFDFIKQTHLLLEQLVLKIVDEVEMGEPIKRKLDFYTQQYINLFSPANFLFTNPEVLELTIKTKGKNLWDG